MNAVEKLKAEYFRKLDALMFQALKDTNFNKTKAALTLGVTRDMITCWVRTHMPEKMRSMRANTKYLYKSDRIFRA